MNDAIETRQSSAALPDQPDVRTTDLNESPELGRFLTQLLTAEQARRDRVREEELKRLREIQQYD